MKIDLDELEIDISCPKCDAFLSREELEKKICLSCRGSLLR